MPAATRWRWQGLALAIVFDSRGLVLAAALVGALGALGFAVFFGILLQRMRAGAAAAA